MSRTPDRDGGPKRGGETADPQVAESRSAQSRQLDNLEWYHLLFEEAPLAYQSLDEDGRILVVNQSWLETMGYDRPEVVGRWFGEFLTPHYQEAFRHRFRCFKRDGAVRDLEFEMVRKDGRVITAAFTGRIGRDARGKFLRTHCVMQDITARKGTEEDLRRSDERLNTAMDAARLGGWDWDLETGRIIWFGYHAALFGLGDDQFDGRYETFEQYVHPEDRKGVSHALAEARDQGKTYAHEYRVVWPDGSAHWIAARGSFGYDQHGRAIRMTGIIQDITERKRTEEKAAAAVIALRESDRRLREMLENVNLVAIIIDLDGRVTFCNDYLLGLTGWRREEVLGRYGLDLFLPQEVRQDSVAIFRQSMASGTVPAHNENYIVTRDGDRRLISWNSTLLRDTEGNVTGTASIGVDITERRRAAEGAAAAMRALRESERRLREMLETVDLVAVMLDINGNITFCNDYLLKLTGWRREEVMGKSWFELFLPAEVREEVLTFFHKSIDGTTAPEHHENPIVTRSGEQRLIFWNNTLLRDSSGKVIGSAAIGADITEQRRLEEELRQAQKMEAIGQLAGGVAHDFNNMLTVVLGNAQLLGMALADSPHLELVEQITDAGGRAARLAEELLTFARKTPLHPTGLDVNSIVKQTAEVLSRSIGKRIEIRQDISAEPCPVLGDANQLQNALFNLAINARDAMPAGGVLTFATGKTRFDKPESFDHGVAVQPGEYVAVRVSDTGVGMDKAVLSRVFDPFFTTKELGKGTGLGLSSVYGCVKQHNAGLEVASEVGKGSAFTMYLPVSREIGADEPDPPEPAPAATATRRRRARIVVVEDEKGVRDLVTRILKSAGHAVHACHDGGRALRHIAEHPDGTDLVILDMVMPGMSGIEVLGKLKGLCPNVPVLVLSGYGTSDTLQALAREGVAGTLNKPFETADLLAAVARHLRR